MKRSQWFACVGLAVLTACGNGWGRYTLVDTVQKTLPLSRDGTVSVETTNGGIDACAWDRDSVAVAAEIEIRADSRREAERIRERVRLTIESVSTGVNAYAEIPRDRGNGGFWDWVFGRNGQVSVRFSLSAPTTARLNLESVNGTVAVSDILGDLNLQTTNGKIDIRGGSGTIRARTTNGNIAAEKPAVGEQSRIALRTTNGSVRILLPADARADLRASTVNGSIRTDFPLQVEGQITGKRIRGRIGDGGGVLNLETVNGSIRIEKE